MIRRGEYYGQDPSGSGGGPQVDVAVEKVELKPGEVKELLNVENGRLEGEMAGGRFVVYSGKGLYRKHNEDACAVTRDALIVCDGVGGVKYGAEASRSVTKTLAKKISNGKELSPFVLYPSLTKALDSVAKRIEKRKKITSGPPEVSNPLEELETTIAAVQIKGDNLLGMVVGDSRIYIYDKDGELKYISMDSSYLQIKLLESVDEVRLKYPKASQDRVTQYINDLERTSMMTKNIIEDSLSPSGSNSGPMINQRLLYRIRDIQNQLTEEGRIIDYKDDDVNDGVKLSEGDVVLVCSDGLNDMVANNAIMATIKGNLKDISAMRESLLQACLKNGARDNVTLAIYQHGKKK